MQTTTLTYPAAESETGLRRAARLFVAGNHFYLLSALLMLAGCYHLMIEPMRNGDILWHKLRGYLILEVYQIVILASAVWIARRARSLSDAATLYLLEFGLLLDPAIFSEAFLTMIPILPETEGPRLILLAATLGAPVKLLLLSHWLKIDVTPRAMLAFTAAAAFANWGAYPFAVEISWLSHGAWYYLMGWCIALIIILQPLPRAQLGWESLREGATRTQRRWLIRVIALLPAAILLIHQGVFLFLHEMRFHPCYLVGVVGAITLGFFRFLPGARDKKPIFLIDSAAILILLLSLDRINNYTYYIDGVTAVYPPEFIMNGLAPAWGFAGIAALYAFHILYSRRWTAVSRLALMTFAMIIWWIRSVIDFEKLGADGREFVVVHHRYFLGAAFIVIVAIALRWRNAWTSLIAGSAAIAGGFQFAPQGFGQYWPEFVEALLLWCMVLGFLFRDRLGDRRGYAAIALLIAILRYRVSPSIPAEIIPCAMAALFVLIGCFPRQRFFLLIGFSGLAVWLRLYLKLHHLALPVGWTLIGASSALFIMGLWLSWLKRRPGGLGPILDPPSKPTPETTDTGFHLEIERPGEESIPAPGD